MNYKTERDLPLAKAGTPANFMGTSVLVWGGYSRYFKVQVIE